MEKIGMNINHLVYYVKMWNGLLNWNSLGTSKYKKNYLLNNLQ